LRKDDVEGALRAFGNGNDSMLWESFGAFNPQANEIEDVSIAGLRLQLAVGQSGDSLSRLRLAIKAAEATGRRRRKLRLLFLESQMLEGARQHREAALAFDQAVTRASANGMVRVLVDDAWTTGALLGRCTVTGETGSIDLLRELAAPRVTPSTKRDASGEGAGAALRLTTREAQILRLVWKGGSNKAIARDLFLTENTIETHLRRIYEKLGTRKRSKPPRSRARPGLSDRGLQQRRGSEEAQSALRSEHSFQAVHQRFRFKGLAKKARSPDGNGLLLEPYFCTRCNHDDWQLAVTLVQLALELEAVHPWHLDVCYCAGKPFKIATCKEFLGRRKATGVVAEGPEKPHQRVAHGVVVINYRYQVQRHSSFQCS